MVEYLRGGSSALKIYSKSDGNINSILDIGSIQIDRFNCFNIIREHDHLIYWQNSCEKMLRDELNIFPDASLKKFTIVDEDANKKPFKQHYTQGLGLPSLNTEQKLKRLKGLKEYYSSRVHNKSAETTNNVAINLQDNIPQTSAVSSVSDIKVGDKFISKNNIRLIVIRGANKGPWVVYNGESYQTYTTDMLNQMRKVK